MDLSFLSNGVVALCCCDTRDITGQLVERNLRVVTWSPAIKALLIGTADDVAEKAKYRAAVAAAIPCVPAHLLHVAGEFDDLVIPSVDALERPRTAAVPLRSLGPQGAAPRGPKTHHSAPLPTPRRPATDGQLWTEKYSPRSLKEIVGNSEALVTLRTWIQTWSPAKKEVGALVTGPPGIGKTTAVHLLLSAAGYEIIELNASDERSATAIRRTLHDGVLKSSNTGLGAKPRALVLDEVDGMSSGDRGGIGELARILRGGPKLPIICIANERTPRLRPLTNVCMDIRFQRPVKTTIVRALMSGVVAKEGLSITAAELETLCERNGNDIRSLLNFLQFGSAAGKDDLQRLDAFSATGRLFGGGGTVDDKMNLVFVDHGLVPLMVAEGYVAAAEKGRGFGAQDVMARISAAADHLEVADLLDRRIHRTQAWGLLPAATVATAAAARAAGGPAPFQIFPAWLGKASKRSKHRRLLNDLLSRAAPLAPHSGEDACETLQHLRERFGGLAATQDAVAVVDALLEAGMTRDDLLETLAEVGFEELKLDTKRKTALTREWNKRCASKGVKGGDDDSVGSDDYVSDVESVEVDYE